MVVVVVVVVIVVVVIVAVVAVIVVTVAVVTATIAVVTGVAVATTAEATAAIIIAIVFTTLGAIVVTVGKDIEDCSDERWVHKHPMGSKISSGSCEPVEPLVHSENLGEGPVAARMAPWAFDCDDVF